jgi:hypothetical protein
MRVARLIAMMAGLQAELTCRFNGVTIVRFAMQRLRGSPSRDRRKAGGSARPWRNGDQNAQERAPQRKITQSQVDDASYRRCAGRDERCADGDPEISVRQLANAEPCGPSGDPADRRRIARIIETEFGIEGEGNV